MRTVNQVNLSKILQRAQEFVSKQGQLFAANGEVYFDLAMQTLEDKLHLFLYCLSRLTDKIEDTAIVVDIDADNDSWEDSILTASDYMDLEYLLHEFGVQTRVAGEREVERRLKVLTLVEFEELDSAIATDYFISDISRTRDRSRMLSKYNQLVQGGSTVSVWNASLLAELEKRTIQMEGVSESDAFIISGDYTLDIEGERIPIFWLLCRTAPGSVVTMNQFRKFYQQLCTVKQNAICFTSNNLTSDTPAFIEAYVANKKINQLPYVKFPLQFLYLMALLHCTTGKTIDFSGFAGEEDRYLDCVAKLNCRLSMPFYDRYHALGSVVKNKLYFIHYKSGIYPAILKRVMHNLSFKACPLSSILDNVIQDPDAANEFLLYPGMHDTSVPNMCTEETVDLEECDVLDLDVLISEISSRYCSTDLSLEIRSLILQNILFKVLRLLEQKLYTYSRIISLCDVILFRRGSSLYIGVADMSPRYEVTGYLCTKDLYSFSACVTKLIPSSVLFSRDIENDFIHNLCDKENMNIKDAVSRPVPWSLDKTRMLLDAFCHPQKFRSLPKDLMLNDDNLAYSILLPMYELPNYTCRQEEWKRLAELLTSYGLRDLNVKRAPLSIYGGYNMSYDARGSGFVAVYPISLEQCPKESK